MVEVALALVLLAGGGLLVSTVIRLNSVDTGFQPDEVVSMRLTLPWEEYDGPAIGAFFQDLEERVAAIPGVQSVGRVMTGLLFGVSGTDPVTLMTVVALFGAVAVVASYLPALRASRLDPVQALRSE